MIQMENKISVLEDTVDLIEGKLRAQKKQVFDMNEHNNWKTVGGEKSQQLKILNI